MDSRRAPPKKVAVTLCWRHLALLWLLCAADTTYVRGKLRQKHGALMAEAAAPGSVTCIHPRDTRRTKSCRGDGPRICRRHGVPGALATTKKRAGTGNGERGTYMQTCDPTLHLTCPLYIITRLIPRGRESRPSTCGARKITIMNLSSHHTCTSKIAQHVPGPPHPPGPPR